MNAQELRRYLAKQGCKFEPGKGGHVKIILGDKRSVMPTHGANKELKKGPLEAILKQRGLKEK